MYDATFKIVVFGEVGTGKEELVQRYLTNLYVTNSIMTIGVCFEVKSSIVDDNKVKLQIWVFGGEERFRFLLPTYLRAAKGGMFVYDITNSSSLAHIDDWLTVIRKEIKPKDRFPIIFVGTKADLNEDREVPAEEAIKIAKLRGLDGFIECSAKTGENVEEAFEALTRLMLPEKHRVRPGFEQVLKSIQRYINQDLKTNKQITREETIKAIKKSLKLAETDQSWDYEIWALTALEIKIKEEKNS